MERRNCLHPNMFKTEFDYLKTKRGVCCEIEGLLTRGEQEVLCTGILEPIRLVGDLGKGENVLLL